MSQIQPAQIESISELEFALRLNLAMRTLLNHRNAGKLPPHYLANIGRPQKQVRYLLKDVEEYEQSLIPKQ